MFYDLSYESLDKSYYTDRLEELTRLPRSWWIGLSLPELRRLYRRFSKIEKRKMTHENANY